MFKSIGEYAQCKSLGCPACSSATGAAQAPVDDNVTPTAPARPRRARRVANVENVTLIEQPKLIKVKGGPTPPSVAEIRFTMTGLTPQPALYATVTGTGITPIGAAGQLQTASVGGTLPPLPLSCPPDAVTSVDRDCLVLRCRQTRSPTSGRTLPFDKRTET